MIETLDDVVREGAIERRFVGSVEVEDGRTIVGLLAPYNVTATVRDGNGPEYQERIAPGAFRRSLRSPHRTNVLLNYEHRGDLPNVVGSATDLSDSDEGLRGTFRVNDGPIGENALALVRSGAISGLSVCAILHPDGTRIVDGVVERRLFAKLDHVALTTSPAYAGAEILALRSRTGPDSVALTLARNRALRAKYER